MTKSCDKNFFVGRAIGRREEREKMIGQAGGVTYSETQAFLEGLAFERKHPVYSHRNGEHEDPTDVGFYWVDCSGTWTIEWNPLLPEGAEREDVRYFGPIPLPETAYS